MASDNKTEKKNLIQFPREKTKKRNPFVLVGGVVILVILTVTFVGGPALSSIGIAGGRLIFGSYNGRPIEARGENYFVRQRDAIADRLRDNEENDAVITELQLYQVWRQAFENTAIHTAFLDMAEQEGFWVSSSLVDKELVTNGPYGDADGNFDEARYASISNTRKKSIREYVTAALVQEKIAGDIFSPPVGDGEIDFIRNMEKSRRKLRYVVLPFSSYPKDEILAYADAQQNLFKEISLSRIAIFDDEEVARSIAAQLEENPLLFEELARTHSKDSFAEQGGVMGVYAYHELSPFFEESENRDRVFNLEKSTISPVIAEESGWFIYRIDEAASLPSFEDEEAQDKVLAYIQRYERGQIEDYLMSEAEGLRAAAGEAVLPGPQGGDAEPEEGSGTGSPVIEKTRGLVKAAEEREIKVHETGEFPLIYGEPSFSYYDNDFPLFSQITGDDEENALRNALKDMGFFTAVTALKEPGDISEPIILDEAVILVELIEKTESPDDELSHIENYYRTALGTWKNEDLTDRILSSDKLEDNFYSVFGNLMGEN